MLALVLTFDSFPCGALGCYGNEWIDTPHFDRLAAEGFVCDAHVTDSATELSAWWTTLSSGVRSQLLTEADARFRWSGVDWSSAVAVTGRRGSDVLPREWPFAELLRATRERLTDPAVLTGKQLLWLHSAGIPLPCEVPEDVESLYVDEFADRGIDWSQLSTDERAAHPAVQAAYASCLDHFLGELLTSLPSIAATQPLLVAIAGLHGGRWRSIPRREPLAFEQEAQWLRSPSIWWTSSSAHRPILPGRSPALVRPSDLGLTLLEWFELPHPAPDKERSLWPLFDGAVPRIRDRVIIDNRVLWTEHDVTVFAEASGADHHFDPEKVRRYLWPEDLWQVNNVAGTAPELVAERWHELTAARAATGQ